MMPLAELKKGHSTGYLENDKPLLSYFNKRFYLESNTGIFNTQTEQKEFNNKMAMSAVHLDSLAGGQSSDRVQASISPNINIGGVSSGSSSSGFVSKNVIALCAVGLLLFVILKKGK